MKNTLIFLGGAVTGGLAATLYFKRKMVLLEQEYQQITTDEINRITGYKGGFTVEPDTNNTEEVTRGDVVYNKIIKDCNYSDMSKEDETCNNDIDDIEEEDDETVALYTITDDEYGEDDDYTSKILTVFTDKVILDEDNCMVDYNYLGDNIMDILFDKKNKDNPIYVRDDNEKVDYEIFKETIDFTTYNDMTVQKDK